MTKSDATQKKETKPDATLKNKMNVIICRHCHKKVISPELVGLTLVCPHCKLSVNGQYSDSYRNLL